MTAIRKASEVAADIAGELAPDRFGGQLITADRLCLVKFMRECWLLPDTPDAPCDIPTLIAQLEQAIREAAK